MHYYDYSFGIIDTMSTSAEWTTMMREEALKISNTSSEPSEPSEPSAQTGIVTLIVVTSLFLISLGTLTFGTVKVVEKVINLHQQLVPMQVNSWQHLQ
jgi:spore coat protein U-like protein